MLVYLSRYCLVPSDSAGKAGAAAAAAAATTYTHSLRKSTITITFFALVV